jgi:tetratricopeptide (TPR) repeat protein
MVIGIVGLRWRNSDLLFDSFERRHLAIKLAIVVTFALVFVYISAFVSSYIFVKYQVHTEQVQNFTIQHYGDLILDSDQALDSGNYDEAIDIINHAIAVIPTESGAYEKKAQILYTQGNHNDALININKGISLDTRLSHPADDTTHLHPFVLQSSILYALGKYGGAADSIQDELKYDPSNFDQYKQLAEKLNSSAQYSHALVAINAYLGYYKYSPEAYIDRGISYYWLNQCQAAMANIDYAYYIIPKYEYLADDLSSTTLSLFNAVMHDADKYTKPGSCVDAVE